MIIPIEELTDEHIELISVGDKVHYKKSSPSMGGNKTKIATVKEVNATQVLFEEGFGLLKKQILRRTIVIILAVDIKNIN